QFVVVEEHQVAFVRDVWFDTCGGFAVEAGRREVKIRSFYRRAPRIGKPANRAEDRGVDRKHSLSPRIVTPSKTTDKLLAGYGEFARLQIKNKTPRVLRRRRKRASLIRYRKSMPEGVSKDDSKRRRRRLPSWFRSARSGEAVVAGRRLFDDAHRLPATYTEAEQEHHGQRDDVATDEGPRPVQAPVEVQGGRGRQH